HLNVRNREQHLVSCIPLCCISSCFSCIFFVVRRPPPRSTLFPYTTLFRSHHVPERQGPGSRRVIMKIRRSRRGRSYAPRPSRARSEEHTSELQSLAYLVCRLLLEKKNNTHTFNAHLILYGVICYELEVPTI